jgi:hypothetical protein
MMLSYAGCSIERLATTRRRHTSARTTIRCIDSTMDRIVRSRDLMRFIATLYCALVLGVPASVAAGADPGRQAPSKPFASVKWGIALDYPAEWSMEDDGDEVTFRSEGGRSIVLGRSGIDSPSEPAPGRRTAKPDCSTTTTPHNLTAIVCVDPASRARRAVLVMRSRDGVESRLAVSTRDRDPKTFDALLSSVRRYP